MYKAIFIDRDGTIAKDVRYCSRPEDFEFLPAVLEGLRLLAKTDYKLIVITNQSGIARGYFTEVTLGKIHEIMKRSITEKGGRIDAIYYCPHHPNDKCDCRKPQIGLFKTAARDWDINLTESYFIGDKYLDVKAANNCGCKAILIPSEYPELEEFHGHNGFDGKIDVVTPNFKSAALWIISDSIQKLKVTLVIPTKNEADNLPTFLDKIPKDFEVVLVDGNSSDNTIEVAKRLRPDVVILNQTGKGKGNGMRLAFCHATGDIIVTFDADGSFNIKELERFIEPLHNEYDLVKGSRFMTGGKTKDMPLIRRIGNWVLTVITNILFGSRYTDIAYGFHAFRKDKLEKLNLTSDGFEIDAELYCMALKNHLNVIEVASVENRRIFGVGKLRSMQDGFRILKTIIRVRFT